MAYTSTVARLLHKRLAHNFVYADDEQTPHFSVSSIYRDFGLNRESLLKQKVAGTKDGMPKLLSPNVIAGYTINPVDDDFPGKNKLTDQIFDLTPHEDFIEDVIKANKDVKRRNGKMNIEKNCRRYYATICQKINRAYLTGVKRVRLIID